MLKGNALVGQSGGPTSVINASLQGVIRGVQASEAIETLYGMRFGIDGFMSGNMVNLSAQSKTVIGTAVST